MTHERSSTVRGRERRASPADIDALAATIAATVTLAERTRSDAAGTLLRRALALITERRVVSIGAPDGEEAAEQPRTFRPP